jgi:RimJ/RimL family protein N-acetyltransferase
MNGSAMAAQPVIVTDRLRLVALERNAAASLHAFWIKPEVRRFLWDGEVIPMERTVEILQRNEQLFSRERAGLWAIQGGREPEMYGVGGYWYFREPPERELLLALAGEYWHQGFATEAGVALIGYGFAAAGWSEIRGSCDAANEPSRRLMVRLGMAFEKRAIVDGIDTAFYRACRGEWRGPQGPP